MEPDKAWREGWMDGLLGRNSLNPHSWDKVVSMAAYNRGYYYGKSQRKREGITIYVERMEA